jgi:hypothetical protein
MRSLRRGYGKDKEDTLSQLSFETPACRDMNLGAEELNWGSLLRRQSKMIKKRWQWFQLTVDSPSVKGIFYVCYSSAMLEGVTQRDWYNYYVKIRCPETASGDCKGEGTPRKLSTATQPHFREKSPISSRQLVSKLAGANWGDLHLSSCSHRLKWVCSSDVTNDLFFNFVHLPSAMEDNNTDPVIIWW